MADENYGTPTPEQLAKINRLTKRPFAAEEVFVHRVKMVGDAEVPNRNMKLDTSLLAEFARQAQNGDVAYMLNHRWSAWFGLSNNKGPMNLGRVFDSWTAEAHDLPGETMAQYADIYIPRGMMKDGTSTDEVIQSIEDGTQRDVSIGFGFSKPECSICANDIRSSKCEHMPGATYDGVKCLVVAKPPGDEFEVSGVYAGAYPTAGALSADHTDPPPNVEEFVDAEALKRLPEGAQVYAAFGRNDVKMWVPKGANVASFSVGKNQGEGGDGVSEWDKFGESAEALGISVEQATVVLSKVNEVANSRSIGVAELAASLDSMSETPAAAGDALDGAVVKQALGKEYDAAAVLLFAKDGLALRESVIDECVKMRVRGQGNAFDADTYKASLHKGEYSIGELRDLTEGFRAAAGEALSPGRATVPAERKDDKPKSYVPAEAFMVRK